MEDSARISIVVAAANMAGPVGANQFAWNAKVLENATLLMELAGEGSKVSKVIEGMANSKTFYGTVISIAKEESSTRGLVTLKTRPSKVAPGRHRDGAHRTLRHQGRPRKRPRAGHLPDQLVGHRVQLWVENEGRDDGSKGFRVIRHIKDLGVDKEQDAAVAAA